MPGSEGVVLAGSVSVVRLVLCPAVHLYSLDYYNISPFIMIPFIISCIHRIWKIRR